MNLTAALTNKNAGSRACILIVMPVESIIGFKYQGFLKEKLEIIKEPGYLSRIIGIFVI